MWHFSPIVYFISLIVGRVVGTSHGFQCSTPDSWMSPSENGTGRNFYPGTPWPNAVVKYELHNSLSAADRREVQRAFDDIQSKTCVKFELRRNGDRAYTSIEADDSVCGEGHLCRTGGYQYAKFGKWCRTMNTMVHELGHNLCLHHEHARPDRDDYLDYRGCPAPPKETSSSLRGSLYDYLSQMHYQCHNCLGGWPKSGRPERCGQDVTTGLSVLDADKINDLYDCKDCRSHRWKPIDALADADRRSMVQFGRNQRNESIYMCRAGIEGEISIGKYFAKSRICYIPYRGREHAFRNKAQVFTLPGGQLGNSYRVTTGNSGRPVPCGRTGRGVQLYCAFADLQNNGKREFHVPGKVLSNRLGTQFFALDRREFRLNRQANILRCG